MSPAELESLTIPALLAATVARQGDQPALGTIRKGTLVWRCWNDLAALVARVAEALVASGVQPGDRVAQLSPNCEGWIVADLSIQQLGAVHRMHDFGVELQSDDRRVPMLDRHHDSIFGPSDWIELTGKGQGIHDQ